MSARRLERAVADGRLIRIRRGVYVGAAGWPVDAGEQHLLRAWAEQLVKPEGAVSHRSAARYWGLPLPHEAWADEPVWLTLPQEARFRSVVNERLVQRVADLPADQVEQAPGGNLVTSLPRTAADAARGLPLPESLIILDAALRQICARLVVRAGRREYANPRLVAAGREALMEAAAELPRSGDLLRAVGVANPLRESPIESRSYGYMVEFGLPLPVCQPPIRTSFGLFFPDFYWEEARLIGESDGRVKYKDSAAVMYEREREQWLRDLKYRFVRWSGKEIHLAPAEVMARILRQLD